MLDADPLVLLYGATSIGRPLRSRGMSTSTVRSLKQITQPKEDLQARAIVLGAEVLGRVALESTIKLLIKHWPLVDLLIWAPKATGSFVRNALSAGAKDVILSSSAEACAEEVVKVIEAQTLLPRAARLGDERNQKTEFEGLYSRSQRMWDLFDTTTQVASTDATVLITGETGTGKELLARAVHRHSNRSGRFVPINCGAVTESLVDSELFGHVKGAFTGAEAHKEGLFKHAQEGTLFLDEIGNVPLTAQYRLLRALQEGKVRPVGGHEEIPVDVRVVAATSNALEGEVKRGAFREDLFYRLDVIRLEVPPLRQRPDDIVFLFGHFARNISQAYKVERPDLTEDFLDALVNYKWPGNVRQLENFTERLILTRTGTWVDASVFDKLLSLNQRVPTDRPIDNSAVVEFGGQVKKAIDTNKTLQETLEPKMAAMERAYIDACLSDTKGRVGEAAKKAGISRRTMLRKLIQHQINKEDYRSS